MPVFAPRANAIRRWLGAWMRMPNRQASRDWAATHLEVWEATAALWGRRRVARTPAKDAVTIDRGLAGTVPLSRPGRKWPSTIGLWSTSG